MCERKKAIDAALALPTSPCGDPKQSCPKIIGSFGQTEVKCGNEVELQADAANIPDGSGVIFTLYRLPGHDGFENLSHSLKAAKVRGLVWTVKKPTDDWPKPEIGMRVSSASISGEGNNALNIYRYPDQKRELKSIPCQSDVFKWEGKYDIEFTAGVVLITVKIKLINRLGSIKDTTPPAIGEPVSASDKAAMKIDIESKLSEKWCIHRQDCKRGDGCDCPKNRLCCWFKVQIQVEFVESGEHHTVDLFQGDGRASSNKWTRVKTRDSSWAHETGHLLGFYDEYVGGAVGKAPRWKSPRPGALMQSGLDVPSEYYWDFRDWFAGAAHENWKLLTP